MKDSLDILRTDYISDDSEDTIEHHGIKGMHWGIRRFQPYGKGYSGAGKFIGKVKSNVQKKYRSIRDKKYREYDTSYDKGGSASGTRSKYTNIDGSLNEKGRFHSQAYISKQLKKNEKYYDKVIKKYNKRAEEYKDDPEMQKKFQDLAKEAEKTKNAVDNSIKGMDLDSVMRNESIDHEQALKAIQTAAKVTIGAAGGSLAIGGAIGLANAMNKDKLNPKIGEAVANFDVKQPIDSAIDLVNSTSIGAKAYEATDTALRTYFDAKAYVIGTGLDQANIRLQKLGVYDDFGKSIGQGIKAAGETSGYTPDVVQNISSNFSSTTSNLVNVANSPNTTHLINAAQQTANQAIQTGSQYASQISTSHPLASVINNPSTSQFIQSGTQTVSQALNNSNVANTLTSLNEVNSPPVLYNSPYEFDNALYGKRR